jgi:pre-mRNA-processing factor SLU7
MPDEVVPQHLELDYDGKRDRWAGYNPEEYAAVVAEYDKLDELRKQAKAKQLLEEIVAKGGKAEEAAAAAEQVIIAPARSLSITLCH